jgi:stringent starvation protein B
MSDASTKPYLIRAIHEWCTDQGYTPYLAVSVNALTLVPREYVRNGEIVLNVGHLATNRLSLGNEVIEFQARFNGSPRDVSVPIEQVTAIYARETGHGMAFEVSKPPAEPQLPALPPPPSLRALELVNDSDASGTDRGRETGPHDNPDPGKSGSKGGKPRPALKRIK